MATREAQRIAQLVRARQRKLLAERYPEEFKALKAKYKAQGLKYGQYRTKALQDLIEMKPMSAIGTILSQAREEIHQEENYTPAPVGKHSGPRGWQAAGHPRPGNAGKMRDANGRYTIDFE